MRSLLAIANADAGTSSEDAVSAAVDQLRHSYEVTLETTSDADELTTALAAHPHVYGVVVLGGDGSLHAVVTALHTAGRLAEVTIGLVPFGTGNDFAASLGLPDDPTTAAAVIATGHTRPVDLIIDGSDGVVVNAAHIGIGAEAAVAARPWKKLLGPLGYPVGAVLAVFSTSGARLDVRVDGEPLPPRGPMIQVAVGNGRFVGGGAPLLPEADPFDGRLDIAVSYAAPLPRRIAYAWHLRRGGHHRRDDVVYLRGSEVTVRGDALHCTSDGELGEPSPTHSWRIEPGALTMYVP